MGQIDLSRHAIYGYDQRIEVFGGGGMVTSDNVPAFNSQMFNAGGKLQVSLKHSFCERYADSYVLEMNHFVNVIRNKESLLVSKDDVIRSWNVVGANREIFPKWKTSDFTLDCGRTG